MQWLDHTLLATAAAEGSELKTYIKEWRPNVGLQFHSFYTSHVLSKTINSVGYVTIRRFRISKCIVRISRAAVVCHVVNIDREGDRDNLNLNILCY